MKEWIIANAQYFISDWENLLTGGIVVVSVIIFLVGLLKKLLINKIKNRLVRKVILAWTSLLLVLPVTAVYMVYNNMSLDNFWFVYAVNCIATVLIYWLYENAAIRNMMHAIGRKTITLFAFGKKSSNEDIDTVVYNIKEDLTPDEEHKSSSHYKDDDLDNI